VRGAIFLIQNDGQLMEMNEQGYDSEDILQTLLAKYPNLLAGDQINSAVPRRWLLISREASLPSEEDGAGRWAVDHLFLDQDAIPTLVEVKRSTDAVSEEKLSGRCSIMPPMRWYIGRSNGFGLSLRPLAKCRD